MTCGIGKVLTLIRRWPRCTCVVILGLALLTLAGLWLGGYFGPGRSYRLAEQAIARGDFQQALEHLQVCVETAPDSAPTLFLAARTARRAGQFEQARKYLARCQTLHGTPTAEVELEHDLLRAQQGDVTAREARLKALIDQGHPDRFLILEACVAGYLKMHHLPRALMCLNWWLERRPDEVQALLWRAWVSEQLHRYDEAARDLLRAVELAPGRAEAQLRLAQFLLDRSKIAEAAEHFQRALTAQPNNQDARLGLARCRRRQGNLPEARQLLNAVLANRPEDPTAVAERGLVALAAGETAEAEPYLRRAAVRLPDDRELVYNLGLCLERLGDVAGAREWQGRLKHLEKDLRRIDAIMRDLPTSSKKAALRHEAALLYLKYGKRDQAFAWLLAALEADPAHRPTHEALADCYEAAGQHEQATLHRERAGPGTGDPPPLSKP